MELRGLSCCALSEIDGLDSYDGDPEEFIDDFCAEFAHPQYAPGGFKKVGTTLGDPGAHYVFTALVRSGDGNEGTYGDELAAYIRKHKLGAVVQSPIRLNRQNYEDHYVRAWIWSPSPKGLKRWWDKHKEK